MGVGALHFMRNKVAVLTFSSLTPELTEDAPAGAASDPFFPFFPLLAGAPAPPCTSLFLTTGRSQQRSPDHTTFSKQREGELQNEPLLQLAQTACGCAGSTAEAQRRPCQPCVSSVSVLHTLKYQAREHNLRLTSSIISVLLDTYRVCLGRTLGLL